MITKLNIKNFKSLKNAELSLGKITVLTGANNSGKSSILYSALVLKNTINNPNQSIDNCLTLPFINLGGFQQTVFNKNEDLNIDIEATVKEDDLEVSYSLSIGKKVSKLIFKALKPYQFDTELEIAFPYPANKEQKFNCTINNLRLNYSWNGIIGKYDKVEKILKSQSQYKLDIIFNSSEYKENITKIFNLPIRKIINIDFVPIQRGFTKPDFGTVPLQSQITTEAEIATLLVLDRELVSKVAHYLEKIVDRSFSVYSIPGISSFKLQTRDKKNGFTSDLVNEGLGTNQLVTILAKCLQKNNQFICIDEPEIHLHPTIIDKLVTVLIDIAESENKQFLISTHSEHFVNSLLKNIVTKKIKKEDLKIYYLDKTRKETKIEEQTVNDKGQIKGGLKHFYQTELDDLKTFFKISE